MRLKLQPYIRTRALKTNMRLKRLLYELVHARRTWDSSGNYTNSYTKDEHETQAATIRTRASKTNMRLERQPYELVHASRTRGSSGNHTNSCTQDEHAWDSSGNYISSLKTPGEENGWLQMLRTLHKWRATTLYSHYSIVATVLIIQSRIPNFQKQHTHTIRASHSIEMRILDSNQSHSHYSNIMQCIHTTVT